MKLEKFKKESIVDKNVLSAIKGGASGMGINRETTAYEIFFESTCDGWNCMDMQGACYEDGTYIRTITTLSNADCL